MQSNEHKPDGYKVAMLHEWDQVTSRVKGGLTILGHDIPIVAHSQESDLEAYRKSRKADSPADTNCQGI